MKCYLCQSENTTLYLWAPSASGRKLYNIFRCLVCGLYFLAPKPSPQELNDQYTVDYAPFLISNSKSSLFGRFRRWLYNYRKLGWVSSYRKGSVLDVGSGTGEFLAKWNGHSLVKGVEPSKLAADYSRKIFKLSVFNGYLKDLPNLDERLNLVTLWNVIEHLDDPLADLKRIKKLIKKGGKVVILTPNINSWEVKYFRSKWAGLEIPKHLFLFNTQTIRTILNQSGFRVIKLETPILDHVYILLLSLVSVIRSAQWYWRMVLIVLAIFASPGILISIFFNVFRKNGSMMVVHATSK